MKNYRQLTLILFFVTLLLNGCNSRPHYEKAIDKWLYENLNDYSSYEPIEFEVLSHFSGLEISIDLFSYKNVIQRKIWISEELLNEIRKIKNDSTNIENELSENLKILANAWFDGTVSISGLDSVNYLVDQGFEKLNSSISDVKKVEYLELLIQYEGVSDRYHVEFEKLKRIFTENGIDIENLENDIKNGLFVKHSYRAKNVFGGSMIYSSIFILNEEKENVKRVIKNEN